VVLAAAAAHSGIITVQVLRQEENKNFFPSFACFSLTYLDKTQN